MLSSFLYGYEVSHEGFEKRSQLAVHSLLGFTFKCSQEFADLRWTGKIEVDHLKAGHHVNLFTNMDVLEKGKHRQKSGAEGGKARWKKARLA